MSASNQVWDPALDESPCELCPHAAACGTGDSCPAFASFVQFGGRRWRKEARVPDGEGAAGLGQRDAHSTR